MKGFMQLFFFFPPAVVGKVGFPSLWLQTPGYE